jgi:hypothetical protein
MSIEKFNKELDNLVEALNKYKRKTTEGGGGRAPLPKEGADALIQFIFFLNESGVSVEEARSVLSENGVSFAHEIRQNSRPSMAAQDEQKRMAAGQKGKERVRNGGGGGEGGHPRLTPSSSFMKR